MVDPWRRSVAGVVLVCAAAGAQPALANDDVALLRAYRPELRYDRSERHFAMSIRSWLGRSEPEPVVYGRSVRRPDGGRWLQYWLFYAVNPQDRGLLRTGRHEGDWELVQLRLDSGSRPERATLREHTWAQGCRWSELAHTQSDAPVVYVANGSHANYSRAGVHDRPWPDPNDEADGRGRALRPPVEPVTDTKPRWIGWPGRFGNSDAAPIPGEQSSPRGPAFQSEWSDPARFEREARACTAKPPGRAWQAPLTVALLAVPALVLLARARRHRRPCRDRRLAR